MKPLAFIGARKGSRGVPEKNIRLLDGHPLIAYSIFAAQKAGLEIVISTDCPECLYAAASMRVRYMIKRPVELATDTATDKDWIAHAINYFSDVEFDTIVLLRPTTPLRDPEIIKRAMESFDPPSHSSMRSVEVMSESAFKCCTMFKGILQAMHGLVTDGMNEPNERFQKTYRPNGYVDIYRRDVIELGGLSGSFCGGFMTDPVIEVDTEHDWELLECWVARHPEDVRRVFG